MAGVRVVVGFCTWRVDYVYVKVQWGGSNEAVFQVYIRCLCFMFAYSVLNLLTIHDAGQCLHFHRDLMNA